MNITIDARLALNTATGIGNYLIHLIGALLSIDAKNMYRILIREDLNRDHLFHQWQRQNLIIEKSRVAPVRPGQHIFIPLKLHGKAIDVYHYPHFDLPLWLGHRSVATIHDLKYIIAPEYFPEFSALKKLYMMFFYRMTCGKAEKIIVVSESTKRDLARLFQVPDQKITVIPLASSSNFSPTINKDEIQARLSQVGLKKKYCLVVGERRPHKNLTRIIEAFQIFRRSGFADYQLVIIGKKYGNYSEPENKIKQLKLEDHVILAGYVPEEVLPTYYQGAEALVFASLYEGFGIPILEAMRCGTPVITSNISSMPKVAADAAICVNPLDVSAIAAAMKRLAQQPDLRMDLISRGLRRANMFSWNRTAEQTLSVYHEVYSNAATRQN